MKFSYEPGKDNSRCQVLSDEITFFPIRWYYCELNLDYRPLLYIGIAYENVKFISHDTTEPNEKTLPPIYIKLARAFSYFRGLL